MQKISMINSLDDSHFETIPLNDVSSAESADSVDEHTGVQEVAKRWYERSSHRTILCCVTLVTLLLAGSGATWYSMHCELSIIN